jgi:hypothetical protein
VSTATAVASVPRPPRFLHAPATALGQARVDLGWTQARAVHALATTATAWGWSIPEADSLTRMLRRWESGNRHPAPDYVMLLAAVYGRPAEALGIARPPIR